MITKIWCWSLAKGRILLDDWYGTLQKRVVKRNREMLLYNNITNLLFFSSFPSNELVLKKYEDVLTMLTD